MANMAVSKTAHPSSSLGGPAIGARVAELADALVSKTSSEKSKGSIPFPSIRTFSL
jgi:hypothetical protein